MAPKHNFNRLFIWMITYEFEPLWNRFQLILFAFFSIPKGIYEKGKYISYWSELTFQLQHTYQALPKSIINCLLILKNSIKVVPVKAVTEGLPLPISLLTAIHLACMQAFLFEFLLASPYQAQLSIYYTIGSCFWKKLSKALD